MGLRKLIRQSVAGDTGRSVEDPEIGTRIDVPTRTLSPVSFSTVNSLRSSQSEAVISIINTSSRTSAENAENSSTELKTNMNSRRQSDVRAPLKPHINRNDPVPTSPTTNKYPDTNSQFPIQKTTGTANGLTNGDTVKMPSSPEKGGLPRSPPTLRSSPSIGELSNLPTSRPVVNGFTIAEDNTTDTNNIPDDRATSPQQGQQWSSAIGKANLGKSGRVIEKLMAENDALKRELKFEKLKSEEAKQAFKMAETKLQQKMSEVESELHEASIIKAQLKRSDRRLADLKAAMDGEKQRVVAANEAAQAAQERADAVIRESQGRVNHETNLRMLAEGSYNTFRNHYKDEKEFATGIVQGQQSLVDKIYAERREDAKRLAALQNLIESQDKHIVQLTQDKAAIVGQYENYKKVQESGLVGIKTLAKEQEEKNAANVAESAAVLGQLRWALNLTNLQNSQQQKQQP